MSGVITLIDLKDYIALGTDTSNDGTLQRIVDSVNHFAEIYCRRKFLLKRIIRDAYDGWGGTKLWLRQTPITEIERIEYGYGSNLTILDASYYSWTQNEVFTDGISDYKFAKKTGYWKTTYSGGYNQNQMPADLVLVLCEIGNLWWLDKSGRLGSSGKNMAGWSENYVRELSPTSQLVLNSYRKMAV